MKKKIVFCCLLLLFASGCFSVTEWFLGCGEEPKKVAPTIVASCTVVAHYRYWPPQWWYVWQYDTGGRCWWLDYNIDPVYWPRPRLTYKPRCEVKPITKQPRTGRRPMIPRDTKAGIDYYVDNGVPTGSFLRAVLSNDLFEAVARADDDNKLALAAICEYIWNFTPNTCHGSPEVVSSWLRFHRESAEAAFNAAGDDRERRKRYYD